MYYELYTEKKKIPTVIFLAILILIFLIVFIYNQTRYNFVKKSSIEIDRFEIGNITSSSATIFWHANKQISGYVKYGKNPKNLDKIAYHQQDKSNLLGRRDSYLIDIKNLDIDSNYYFILVLDNQFFSNVDGKPFSFKTALTTKKTSEYSSVYGKVVNERGDPVKGAILILAIEKVFPLISYTKEDGSFIISLRSIFSKNDISPITHLSSNDVNLEIIDDKGNFLKISTRITDISPNAGKIVLKKGKSSLFTNKKEAERSIQNVIPTTIKLTGGLDIIYPVLDAALSGNKPLYKGTAPPNSEVLGTIYPEKDQFKVKSDSLGVWRFDQTKNLNQGEHELVVKIAGVNKKTTEKKRKFIVLKSGEAVLGQATPSASLSPTISQPITTATPFLTPTQPSATLSATPVATIIDQPTITPVPIETQIITVTPLPTSGIGDLFSYSMVSFGLIILGIGLIMLF